eukprot:gb/GFBE01040585.1/.p1 GENE.gb/GFBE01040585.1/~~gb/GFBE01040585.1/.p1  ORF type:complete len:117 (+),score=18.92 gb/GFBE01040585.1/:1-351(+)
MATNSQAAGGNHAHRLIHPPSLDDDVVEEPQPTKRKLGVAFTTPTSTRAVTPYGDLYGKHPSEFHFDRKGRMLPARSKDLSWTDRLSWRSLQEFIEEAGEKPGCLGFVCRYLPCSA